MAVIQNQINAQTWQWVQSYGSNFNSWLESGNEVIYDPITKYIYVAGAFDDTVNIGPFTLMSQNGREVFIAKFDTNGTVIWAKQPNSYLQTNVNSAESITLDENGNIYITGWYRVATIFDTDTLTSLGGDNTFIIKMSPSGNVLWAKSAGAIGNDLLYPCRGTDITYDNNGNILVTGNYSTPNPTSFIAGSITVPITVSSGGFIAKFDTSGNTVWVIAAGNLKGIKARAITSDDDGSIYSCGATAYSGGGNFIQKFNKDGILLWTINDGTNSSNYDNLNKTDIEVDLQGYIYQAGKYWGTSSFLNNGTSSGYLIKLDSSGSIIWARAAGTYANNLKIDPAGNPLIAGTFCTFTGCQNILGSDTLTSNSYSGGGFYGKFTSDGNLIDKGIIPGRIGINAIAEDAENLYVTGFIIDSAIFVDTVIHTSSSTTSDLFLAKTKTILSPVTIDENNLENNIYIFPNPFSMQTTLRTEMPIRNAKLTVYNCFGQTVAQIKNLNGQTILFNRDNLVSGIYFVQLTHDNKIITTKKIIITD